MSSSQSQDDPESATSCGHAGQDSSHSSIKSDIKIGAACSSLSVAPGLLASHKQHEIVSR
jgi:hypothetical protein